MLRFTVSDSGIGLSDEAKDKLFTAFTQADNTTSRTYGGTGLGLSISKQLVELMGGEIGVESTVGVGSAFWFTILYRPVKGKIEAPDKARSTDRWVASRPLKVLVAEDNLVNQQMIKAIFGSLLKHEVTIADNGLMATEYVGTRDFDFILMDVRMPVMDGLEATAIIRSMDTDKSDIPIIALTADIEAGNIKEYTDIGMNGVCAKPIDLPVLLKTIDSLLGEEIHTPVPKAPSAKQEAQDTNVDDEATKDGATADTGFAQVLERVSNMADQASSLGTDESDPLPEMAAIIGDKFPELLVSYDEALTAQCDKFKAEISELEENLADDEIKSKAKELTHSVKGGGGTFGYHLITAIATQADDLLSGTDALEAKDVRALGNHANALILVAGKKMSGTGGTAGRILLKGLKDFS